MKVAGDIAVDCEQPFPRSLDVSALNNKSKYIFEQSYLSLSFIKTKVHQLTDRCRIDIAFGGLLFNGSVDGVVSHIFHDPIGGCFKVVLVLDESSLGCVGCEAHIDEFIYIAFRILHLCLLDFKFVSYLGSILQQKVRKIQLLLHINQSI